MGKLDILVVNTGRAKSSYGDNAMKVMSDYCSKLDYNLTVFDDVLRDDFVKNSKDDKLSEIFSCGKEIHPAWFKMLCHQILDSDFILAWDLDLLPTRRYGNDISPFLNYDELNMCFDNYLLSTANPTKYNDNFYYNSGLVGIPKRYGGLFKNLFETHVFGDYPSYEQYYLNDKIACDNIHIHRVPISWNTYTLGHPNPLLFREVNALHYTRNVHEVLGGEQYDTRAHLIGDHMRRYFQQYGESCE